MIASDTRISVLLVEDEALIRILGVDMLEDAGFVVFEAVGADEAMVILAEQDGIDLLFSDIDMPGSMDGLELARLVHQRWPDVRILLTSGHHRLAESALPDGGRFLRKHWTQASMIEKVQSTLAH